MKALKVLKSVLYSILYMLTYSYFQVASSVLFAMAGMAALAKAYWPVSLSGGEYENLIYHNVPLVIFAAALLTLLVFWGILSLRKKKLKTVFPLSRVSAGQVAACLAIALSANVLVQTIMSLPYFSQQVAAYQEEMLKVLSGPPILVFLAVSVAAPIVEELLFRGLVQNELSSCMPAYLAIVLQGLAFGAFHGNWVQGVYAAFAGILFGYIFYKTKNILLPILAHMAYNAFTLPLDTSQSGVLTLICTIVPLIFIGFSIILLQNKKSAEYS